MLKLCGGRPWIPDGEQPRRVWPSTVQGQRVASDRGFTVSGAFDRDALKIALKSLRVHSLVLSSDRSSRALMLL